MKIKLNENQLNRIIAESVKWVLNEIGYNQFSDDDFGGSGDPYGLVDSDMEETNDSLDGFYGNFNNIAVNINGDGTPDAVIEISSTHDDKKTTLSGLDAQKILDKIKTDKEKYGDIHISIYRNLYKYVL